MVNSEVTPKEKCMSLQQKNMTEESKHSYSDIHISQYDESTEEAGIFYWLLYNWIYLNYCKIYLPCLLNVGFKDKCKILNLYIKLYRVSSPIVGYPDPPLQ